MTDITAAGIAAKRMTYLERHPRLGKCPFLFFINVICVEDRKKQAD